MAKKKRIDLPIQKGFPNTTPPKTIVDPNTKGHKDAAETAQEIITHSVENLLLEPGTREIIFRTGPAAPPLRERRTVGITGTISAPADFLEVKAANTALYDPLQSHALVSRKDGSIKLVLNESDALGDAVTGRLEVNPLLTDLWLGTGKARDNREMVRVLKKYRPYYPNDQALAFDSLIAKFKKFRAQIQKDVADVRESNGSSDIGVQTRVANGEELSVEFLLELPLYKGEKKTRFRVAIEVEESDADLRFLLESPEAQQLLLDQMEELLKANVAPLKEWGTAIIYTD
jgi:hypothetical protein